MDFVMKQALGGEYPTVQSVGEIFGVIRLLLRHHEEDFLHVLMIDCQPFWRPSLC